MVTKLIKQNTCKKKAATKLREKKEKKAYSRVYVRERGKKRADVPLPDNQEPRRHPLPTRTRSRRHTATYTNIRIHICDNAHLRATHKEIMFVGVPTINNNISFRF